VSLYERVVLIESKLSPAQQRYLVAMVRVFAKANKTELKNWGNRIEWVSEAEVASALGKSADQIYRTGNKVIGAGFAELKTTQSKVSVLDKGPFGKWYGGTRSWTQVDRYVRPTKSGLILAKQLLGKK